MKPLTQEQLEQIIELTLQGLSRREVAKQMNLAVTTVSRRVCEHIDTLSDPEMIKRLLVRKGYPRRKQFIEWAEAEFNDNQIALIVKIWEHGYQTGYNQGRHK